MGSSSASSQSTIEQVDPWARFGASGALLARVARGGRTAPAYVFEGEDREVPRAAARLFASALLCRAASRPCGACSTCRRIASGNHPDVHARGRDKATVISVEALAELLERAHGSPLEGDRQVFVIDPADALAPEAVAMYLKSLEEPPATTTFVKDAASAKTAIPAADLLKPKNTKFLHEFLDAVSMRGWFPATVNGRSSICRYVWPA